MSSQVTADDIRTELYLSGVKDPHRLTRVMGIIEAYACARIRSATKVAEEEPEPEKPRVRRSYTPRIALYLCRKCGDRLSLKLFPEEKQLNPALAVDCTGCGGGSSPKLYKCTGQGMCNKDKLLEEFPERKQQNTSLRTPCFFCDQRRITVKDARLSLRCCHITIG